jgi:hypothetical protein
MMLRQRSGAIRAAVFHMTPPPVRSSRCPAFPS